MAFYGKQRAWKKQNPFLLKMEEKLTMNQYWYSADTLEAMVNEIESVATKVAFLSTPSVYFSLKNEQLRANSRLFDFDDASFAHDNGFVHYNYKEPHLISEQYHHQFDYVVIDPPFITEEVWRKYAQAAHQLLVKEEQDEKNNQQPRGKVLLSTISENLELLHELFNAHAVAFQPSIPNLIYQYNLFTNYSPCVAMDQLNPEIAVEDVGVGKRGYSGVSNTSLSYSSSTLESSSTTTQASANATITSASSSSSTTEASPPSSSTTTEATSSSTSTSTTEATSTSSSSPTEVVTTMSPDTNHQE